jgi:glucose/arabinose dehydrogenase
MNKPTQSNPGSSHVGVARALNRSKHRMASGHFFLVLILALLTLAGACHRNHSSSVPTEIPGISLVKVASGLTHPVHLAPAGDGSGRLFVVEQGGQIKIIRNGTVLPNPFLDVSALLKSSSGEQGLLSVVFPPGYASGKDYFYIYYTGQQGIGDTVLARYRITTDPDAADSGSGLVLLTIVQPFANHNGGQLAFGPDGYLYIGVGDGGSGGDPFGNGQNPDTPLGKILRIDVESQPGAYTSPPTNPYVGRSGYRSEIWALGLRNPWRFSFDRGTGDLYIADVGQDTFEEIDVQPAASAGGENYGWNIMEGLHCYNSSSCDKTGLTLPVSEYNHGAGDCSVTGGFVYRGREYAGLQGVYIYGDYCSGRIWGLRRTGTVWENTLLLDTDLTISTFGEDEAGNLYVADHGNGDIYKITSP